MSLELWATVASLGTFVVITVSAVAAIVQLRHLRLSNQIAALTEISGRMGSEEFHRDLRFVRDELPAKLGDQSYLFAEMGLLVSHGLIDEDLACEWFGGAVIRYWEDMKDAIAVMRTSCARELGSPRTRWARTPAGEKRIPLEDRWRDEDAQLVRQLAKK
jgi:hypothetical protein